MALCDLIHFLVFQKPHNRQPPSRLPMRQIFLGVSPELVGFSGVPFHNGIQACRANSAPKALSAALSNKSLSVSFM
jgi:hypothetical protein